MAPPGPPTAVGGRYANTSVTTSPPLAVTSPLRLLCLYIELAPVGAQRIRHGTHPHHTAADLTLTNLSYRGPHRSARVRRPERAGYNDRGRPERATGAGPGFFFVDSGPGGVYPCGGRWPTHGAQRCRADAPLAARGRCVLRGDRA